MTFSLVIDQVFRIFPLFSQIFCIFTMLNVAYDLYMTLSSQENSLFQKRIPLWHFFYSVRTFARIRQHYFSKYWGDGCMGRPHTSNSWGTVPPVPPRSPPLYFVGIATDTIMLLAHNKQLLLVYA